MGGKHGQRERYPDLGCFFEAGGARFRIWLPAARQLSVVVERDGSVHPLAHDAARGHFVGRIENLGPGARYWLELDDGRRIPDPTSRFQPDGVHGPSEVIDSGRYRWGDAGYRGVPQEELVLYELHLGSYTPQGSYTGVIEHLDGLVDLGVTALELMPIADFPGRWNWGYDPAALWAPSRAYGRPDELRQLVDEAHRRGLAVLLDVVYNHFGPDGAYVAGCGPFFSQRHTTAWGAAINFDGEGSRGVRDFFIGNALYWLRDFHLDGLRLDATFAIHDESPTHFLAELADAVASLPGPKRYLIAEDDRNLARLARPREAEGYGLDGIWADDFHHVVRRVVAGDRHGYYQDYPDSTAALATTIERGWLFTGQHSTYKGGPRGSDPRGLRPEQFVFCVQNHDQVGNRALGDRLNQAVDPASYRAASALLLLAPQVPLLFMGQEWAASAPFLYFTDHHAELGEKVRGGRREEFAQFPGFHGEVPDPQSERTFTASKLDRAELRLSQHGVVLALYRDLLALRRALPRGPATAWSPVEGAVIVERGARRVVVALRPGLAVPLDASPAIRWHSERAEYVDGEGQPPRWASGRLIFSVPAAAVI